ncbi:MAG: sulfur carrier protein ThiS [Planctomycetota bacterium]|nr:MAG: sulfur carrier protein ThiS [Planctomycetota bacterium]
MQLQINGQARSFPQAMTLAELLQSLEVAGPGVAVERNGRVVPKAAHASTQLADGDRLEVVRLVGGG